MKPALPSATAASSFAMNEEGVPPRAAMAFAGRPARWVFRGVLFVAAVLVMGLLVWQGMTAAGAPNPTAPRTSSTVAVLDIAVLVFREGLECVLVLSAITAGMVGRNESHRRIDHRFCR